MPRRYTCLLWLALCIGGAAVAAEQTLFIGQVPVEDARLQPVDEGTVRYRIRHGDPAVLQSRLGRWIEQPVAMADGVSFSLDGYPAARIAADHDHHRRASFLIDYTEPSVQSLTASIEQRYGEQPSPTELEQFVFDYIADKNSAHGFDVASVVASAKAGDCTEHAVLLTALLRLYGYPARAVTGLYVSLEEPVLAYGHAWVEYYGEGGWSALDGTRVSATVGTRYIPLGVIEDESIGYAMGLLDVLQVLAIERIIVE